MIYSGYTEDELKQVIAILEQHQVPFSVSANEAAISHANEIMKDNRFHVPKRGALLGDNCFYQIEINQTALKTLSPEVLHSLAELRVYPEITDFEFPEIQSTPDIPKKTTVSNSDRLLGYAVVIALIGAGIYMIYSEFNDYFS